MQGIIESEGFDFTTHEKEQVEHEMHLLVIGLRCLHNKMVGDDVVL